MIYVLDTHALIWFLAGSAQLGATARAILSDPSVRLILPATALPEACWIVEHGRTSIPSVGALLAAVDSDPRLALLPLDRLVIDRTTALTTVREMHDRQIVAAALVLSDRGENVSLLTHDVDIGTAGLVPVIW